jgi:hypothetical protein
MSSVLCGMNKRLKVTGGGQLQVPKSPKSDFQNLEISKIELQSQIINSTGNNFHRKIFTDPNSNYLFGHIE